jgi:hypothetical protein
MKRTLSFPFVDLLRQDYHNAPTKPNPFDVMLLTKSRVFIHNLLITLWITPPKDRGGLPELSRRHAAILLYYLDNLKGLDGT